MTTLIDGTVIDPDTKYASATVTLNITPVNDAPFATNHVLSETAPGSGILVDNSFRTLEDTSLTILASDLLAGSLGHANPQIPAAPWDESIQDNPATRVVSLQFGGVVVDQNNASGVPFATPFGTVTDVTFAGDTFVSLEYLPNENFNADNPTSLTSLDGQTRDFFNYTIEDSGVAELTADQGGGLFPVTAMRSTAVAQVYVAPVNDAPVPGNDLVSSDAGGTWTQFFTNIGLPVPPVTEDTPVTIPAAFIIENDLSGPANATDETGGINDSPTVSINPITFTTTLGGTVTLNLLGDLEYTPPMDRFGVDTFEYEVLDQGRTEDLAGVQSNDPLTGRGTISILIDPVNDPPLAFDRLFAGTEDNTITFTADDLLGVGGSMPALPSNQLPPPPAPFDESAQSLRVVAFRDDDEFVDVDDLFDANTGTFSDGTLTMNTASGGLIEFSFAAGAFVSGVYTPSQDYNGRDPFAANELFQYVIADDGIEVIPGTSDIDGTVDDRIIDLPDQRSQPADVTLTVSHVNDPPEFIFDTEVNILERDDNGETTVLNFASDIRPGPLTALDELQRESVFFTLVNSESTVSPPNLFRLPPVFNSDGSLSLFPSPDLFGTSTLVIDVSDSDPNDPSFVPQTVRITMTANVQPVNDPPALDPSVLNTSSTNPLNPADDAFDVSAMGALTFVLPEDNTGAGGATSSYEILATNPNYTPTQGGGIYERPGLLDLYIVGPDNEAGPFLAGSQVLNVASFSATTMLGGTVEAVVDGNDNITSLLYTPPADFNRDIGGLDSFTYTIADDSVVGGETYSLFSEALVDDPRTVNGRVLLDLRPVNDRPEFESNSLDIEIPEDSGRQSLSGFAFNISAGPTATADDENDLITGQTFDFVVEPLSYDPADVSDFFVSAPRVTDGGTLIYETATDIFGAFEYEVTLVDNGDVDITRGDLNATEPVTLTINVLPVNDAPRLVDGVSPLSFSVAEDNPLTLSADGSATPGDLLGSYLPGAINEIPPGIGGGQTNMIVGFPMTTPQGGTLDPILDVNDETVGYTYTPAPNFVGTDFLIYSITDNGQTVPVAGGGLPIDDFQSTEVTIPITVEARNDAPQFSLGNDVTVTEGDGPIEIINWMVGIAAGPADASDEIAGDGAQSLTLTLTEISNDITFTSAPTVVLGGDAATLLFEAEENAFGTAVYDAILMDDGIHDPANDQFGITVHRFTISVAAVNDPPTFTAGGPVTVDEDSGPYNQPWATDISPGPGETDQTVVGFEVVVPVDSQSLFSVQPTISPTGILSFTPAMDAAGQVDIEVVAIDSEGGRSDAVLLSITIVDLNDPPVANDDLVDTDEETVLNLSVEDLLANDVDPDLLTDGSELLTLTLPTSFTTDQGAEVTFNPTTGEIVYDPTVSAVMDAMTDNDTTIDRFSYTISDGEVEDTAEVIITVAGRNDAPRLVDDNLQVSAGQPTVLNILDNDIDVDGMVDATTIIITTQPSNGALEVQPNGTVIYEPLDGFTGIDQFQYTVADDTGQQSQQATVTLRIEVAPQTTTLMTGTFIDTPLDIDALAAVTSGDAVPDSLTIVSGPNNGTLELLGNAQLRYTPGSGFLGDDEIVFTVANADGFISVPTTISISVVESTLENPVMAEDVNASGTVTPLDALLVINKLDSTDGSGSIPVLPTDKGPNYYDVSGNKNVSALDALLVINYMGAAANSPAEGESLETTPLSAIIQLPQSRPVASPLGESASVEQSTDKIVSIGSIKPQVDPATLDLIASDDDEDDRDPTAIDDALTSLLD
ncbi:MAG: Ig-like domain-containing protein [Planctomycetota bacterium]